MPVEVVIFLALLGTVLVAAVGYIIGRDAGRAEALWAIADAEGNDVAPPSGWTHEDLAAARDRMSRWSAGEDVPGYPPHERP